jgi:hypothetical protein
MVNSPFQIECPKCNNFHDPVHNSAFDELLNTSCVAIDASFPQIYDEFGIGAGGRWDADDDTGIIRFTHDDGRSCDALFQFVGTWAIESQTFKWGWDHPHQTEAIQNAANCVLDEGNKINAQVLTSNMLKVCEEDVWHLAKITAYLSNLPANYRARVNDKVWWYICIGYPEWNTAL